MRPTEAQLVTLQVSVDRPGRDLREPSPQKLSQSID